MRIKKKHNKKPLIITLATLVVVAILGALAYLLIAQGDDSSGSTNTPSTQQIRDRNSRETSDNPAIDAEATPSTSGAIEEQKDTQPSYEGPDANTSPSLTGSINYSAVVGSNLVIRTTIDQSLGSGTCELVLTSGAKTVSKSTDITPNPSSSTCTGFDIPVAELSPGNWNITINLSANDKTGVLTGVVKI